MGKSLKGKVAVITGASSGIGRATALRFADKGVNVVLSARREELLDELAIECADQGVDALVFPADVRDERAMHELAWNAVEAFGQVDFWINNAGVLLVGRLDETPSDDCRQVVETNLFGVMNGVRAILPYFRDWGQGVIVNVSSQDGKVGMPLHSCYAASKFAVTGLSESLRMELRHEPGIRVTTILPASIDTPLFDHAANYSGLELKPLRPVYDAEDVAHAIVHACKHKVREMTVGNAGRLNQFLRTIAPRLAERAMASAAETDMFLDEPACANPGNIHRPMWHGADVEGGWKERQGSRIPMPSLGRLSLAAAVAGLGWFLYESFYGEHGQAVNDGKAGYMDQGAVERYAMARSDTGLASREWWEPAASAEQSAFYGGGQAEADRLRDTPGTLGI